MSINNMVPYDGGPTTAQQHRVGQSNVGPPPIPRPPPPPGVSMASPPSADQRHRQHPHMGMPPATHRQPSSMNYALPMPPSPNVAGGAPPGPPYHLPQYASQQRHYPQQRHQPHPPHPSQQHPPHQAPQHSSHHSHHSQHNNPHPSHHPPQHHAHTHPNHHSQSHLSNHHPHHRGQHIPQHSHPHSSANNGANGNGANVPHLSPQHPVSHANSGGVRSQSSNHHNNKHHSNSIPVHDQVDDQNIVHTGLNGEWQSNKDLRHRREMIQQIVKLLRTKDKNASPEWLNKLPQMVKQLEVSLYRSAESFEAYKDPTTLKHRLQQLAIEIQKKTKEAGKLSSSSGRRREGSRGNSQSRGHDSHRPHHSSNGESMVAADESSYRHDAYNRRSMEPRRRQTDDKMHDMLPLMSDGLNNSSSSHHSLNPDQNFSGNASRSGGYHRLLGSGNDPFPYRGDSPSGNVPIKESNLDTSFGSKPEIHGVNPDRNGVSSSSHGVPGSSSRYSRSGSKDQIKHRIQRLLLLHHACKCTAEEGKCTVSDICGDMKRLWKHMARCTDTLCREPHCYSSRSILSHYKECRDPNCRTCVPVRRSLRKSSSRERADSSTIPPKHGYGSRSSDKAKFGNGKSQAGHNPDMMDFHASSRGVPPRYDGKQDFSQSTGPSGLELPEQCYPVDVSSSSHRSDVYGGSNTNEFQRNTQSLPLPPDTRGLSSSHGGQHVYNPSNTDMTKIKHKQQRLLLLRHASKCHYEDGECPHTEHCASMKRLWKHIAECKDQQCKVQHCISSRYVLTHYRNCKDLRCLACRPVRDSISRHHERERQDREKRRSSNMNDELYPGPDDSMQRSRDTSHLEHPPTKRIKRDPNDMTNYGPHNPMSVKSTTNDGMNTSSLPMISSSMHDKTVVCFEPGPQLDKNSEPGKQSIDKGLESNHAQCAEVKSASVHPPQRSIGKRIAEPTPKSVEISSLVNCFSTAQIKTHIKSLNQTYQLSPAELKNRCKDILKGLQSHPHGWVFNNPVDPVELGLPDYFEIIKKPMDLGTIYKRVESCLYHAVEDFASDVYLTFDNATTYNQQGSVVHSMATELRARFAADHKKLREKLKEEDYERRKNERACSLCGCEKILFEPPVFFCNGVNCQSTRIRRNSHYYVGGNNQYYWCNTCYNELDENVQIELPDLTTKKNELTKKKNDEVHEESWVQCDECEKWIHQVCALFNNRQNKEQTSTYCCPECTIKNRIKDNINDEELTRLPMAADLPRTKLSDRLEKHVRKKVEDRCIELAEEKAAVEKCSVEDALVALKFGGPVTIRQVTSTDRKLEVRERMKRRYAFKNYPDEFPFRCKCINVFQNLDGVDVLLFALYVYEHNEKNPPPNSRTVYISYLDSVHFMKPRILRTLVYHEILICYLDYAREKGFATAHIWACPPLKGDDYIFYAKPEDQKTPKDARLRAWYMDMLVECQKRDIVGRVTNMYDLYFTNENLDATAVPYLEGDYFSGEVENVIKVLEEGNSKKGGAGGKKTKKKRGNGPKNNPTKSKNKKSNRSGMRSGSVEEELDIVASNGDSLNLKILEGGRDPVMAKLGEIIQPMKASFIVAFLNWSGCRKEDMIVPKEIEEYRSNNNISHHKSNADQKRDEEREKAREVLKKMHLTETREKTGRLHKIIDDDVEDMDCEFFNNRQSFLDLCRGNHYQFDHLRRAKHTSMMVLWHLHNRDAPKFVQQCSVCGSEILSGFRYNCSICADLDLCEGCFKNPTLNRGNCTHELKPISVDRDNSQEGSGGSGDLDEQRRQTQRNIQLHLRLLEHAAHCTSPKCTSKTCAKMKGFLKHTVECKVQVKGGCKVCKRLRTLFRYHAQQCKNSECPIPLCNDIRVRIRQMQKQQQAMDDRRRHEMNRNARGIETR